MTTAPPSPGAPNGAPTPSGPPHTLTLQVWTEQGCHTVPIPRGAHITLEAGGKSVPAVILSDPEEDLRRLFDAQNAENVMIRRGAKARVRGIKDVAAEFCVTYGGLV